MASCHSSCPPNGLRRGNGIVDIGQPYPLHHSLSDNLWLQSSMSALHNGHDMFRTRESGRYVSILSLPFAFMTKSNLNHSGIASGIAGTVRLLFGAVATAIFSNVLNNQYGHILPGRVASSVSGFNFPTQDLARLTAAAKLNSAAAYAAVPGITPLIKSTVMLANKHAYLDSSRLAFYIAVSFGVVAVVAAIFTADIDKRKYNNHTVAVMETEHKGLKSKTEGDVVVWMAQMKAMRSCCI